MAEPTKAELQEQLAAAQAELADQRPGVYVAVHGVLADMPEIERRRVQTFKAFNVDDIYATVRPLFVKHGLVVLPRADSAVYDHGTFAKGTEFIDARVKMEYDIVAISDGSKHTISFMAEGRDTQDKATNKASQQALKYALIQMLFINTGEDAEEDPGKGDKPVARSSAAARVSRDTEEQNRRRLENAARTAVFHLVGDDKQEATDAWPLILVALRMERVETEADRDLVIGKATEMFGDEPVETKPVTDGSDAPFGDDYESDPAAKQ